MTTLRHHCTHKGCKDVIEYDPESLDLRSHFTGQPVAYLTCAHGHLNRIAVPEAHAEPAHYQPTVSNAAHMNRSRDLPPGIISTLKPVQWKHIDPHSAFSERAHEQAAHDKGIARWRRGRGESH
ncbi:MAG: hypothetical protein U0670_07780 [Anaerolineae bacterium]